MMIPPLSVLPKGKIIFAGIAIMAFCLALWAAYGWAKGKGYEECRTEQLEATGKAMSKALEAERAKQREVNRGHQEQSEHLAAINARLSGRVERLQQRPTRADLSRAARAECEGSTGAELSREDGEFLEREAARADRLRAALRRCYQYADTVSGD